MKTFVIVILSLFSFEIIAQNKNTVFYDSVNQTTSWEGHWAQVVSGRYKSIYDKPNNKRTLERTTSKEFEEELRKTSKRIITKKKLGTDFPDFDVTDINGNHWTKAALKGKVIVVNYWFIGCAPCEMERPALNELTKMYANNPDVVFLSFAKDDKEKLLAFLKDSPVLYQVVATEKDFIKTKFEINEYPVNQVIGYDGKYFFNSEASGIGIKTILQQQIDAALKTQ